MSGEHRVRVVSSGLDLDGVRVPLLSGEIHYFRHDPADWPLLLDGARELGLSTVSSYVPWGVHEVEGGRLDFGERRPELALDRFLDLAADRSLLVALRPGPHVNAELTWLGFPFRVLRDGRAMARGPAGNPVWLPVPPRPLPIPSYASELFLDEACRWLEAVARRVEGRLWPRGPVVLVQLDNEAPLLFRDGPYDQDYSDESLAAFARFLESRGRPPRPPPRAFDAEGPGDLLPHLDWLDHRVDVFARALARMRRSLEGAGVLGIPFTHNLAQGGPLPALAPGALPAADAVGFDFYQQRRLLRFVRARCLYAVGTTSLPFAAELGAGGPWNLPVLSGGDSETLLRAFLAFGGRALNLFMAADRDRWYGAPLDSRGRASGARATACRAVLEAFRRHELHERRLAAPVAVLVPRLYPRLSQASWALGPLAPPSAEALGLGPALGCRPDELGLGEPVQRLWPEALEGTCSALARAGVGHAVVDGEAEDRLDRFRAAVVPSFAMMDRALWQALLARVEAGLELALGPRLPRLGEDGRPLDVPPALLPDLPPGVRVPLGRGGLTLVDLLDGAARETLARDLAARGLASAVRPVEDGVEVTLLEASDGPPLLGVAELDGRPRHGETLRLDGPAAGLLDVLTGERVPVRAGRAAVALEPFSVRLLVPEAP